MSEINPKDYVSTEQVSSEWLRTAPADKELVSAQILEYYAKYRPHHYRPSIVFVDSPIDAILTMAHTVRYAVDAMQTSLPVKISSPTMPAPVDVKIGIEWPVSFVDKVVTRIHDVMFSDAGYDWEKRRKATTRFFPATARNLFSLTRTYLSTWRRWTEYQRGRDFVNEHDLQAIWPMVRRWGYWWNPIRSTLNYPNIAAYPRSKWDAMQVDAFEVAKNAFMIMPFESYCIVIEYPNEIHVDDAGLLHRADGPAVSWNGGFGIWALHGVVVPKKTLAGRGLTGPKIDAVTNVEARRVLIEEYGQERFLQDTGAELVHSDGYGELWRRPARGRETEDMMMVKVVNSTPESDGSYKDYFLRVPPTMTTAEQAVAWTFHLEPGQYAPMVET